VTQPPDQPSNPTTSSLYPPNFFRRADESSDSLFCSEPRLVVHIDEHAIAAIGRYFEQALPRNSVLLDLMSSWRSHLPEGFPKQTLAGLGLNAVEMRENPQLDERIVHDLNANPALPFPDARFDAAFVTVSIQYLTRPVEVFREVCRVLRPGTAFHVIYSNRMFPTKAVAVWQYADMEQRARLILSYFHNAGGWEQPDVINISPRLPFPTDPVIIVRSRKATQT
jgi:SAM-dependent methyltransferase